MSKVKDTEYLMLSAVLRAKEAKLLNKADYERMLLEPDFSAACRIIADRGYKDMSEMDTNQINKALAERRASELAEIRELIPDQSLLDLFRMKYGYHNAKLLVKSKGDLSSCAHLISDSGRFTMEQLREVYDSEEGNGDLPKIYADAIRESRNALARTNNPQLAEFILDKAYYHDMLSHAEKTGKSYIINYIKNRIDRTNLRSTLRTMYMGRRGELLKYALIEGGNISIDEILNSMDVKDDLIKLYSSSIFHKAAEVPTMTEFELESDNAIELYVSSGSYIAFGPEVVIEYVAALENELMALRIILTGRIMGISTEALRGRLRESYV
ncbi:MAG: V-type ATPase subunit [Oscillospiraceae bacterium]|nr:V-type ATPase subunit [Oscillospiraceae bacterium]